MSTGSIASFEDLNKVFIDPEKLQEFFELSPIIKFDDLDYHGFDAQKLITQILTIKENEKMDEATFSKWIQVCVAVGLKRGNIRQDQIDKTADGGKLLINQAIDLFKIKIKKTKSAVLNLSPTDLTFVRFISIFPTVASTLIYKFPDQYLNRQLGKKFGAGNLPEVLRHTGAAAMIPEGTIGKAFASLYTGYMMELSLLINKNSAKMTTDELYQNQKRFTDAAQFSGTISQESRIKWFKTFGLDNLSVFEKIVSGLNDLQKERGKSSVNINFYKDSVDGSSIYFSSKDVDSKIQAAKLNLPVKGASSSTQSTAVVEDENQEPDL